MIGETSKKVSYQDLDTSALTDEEKRALKALLAEAGNRHLDIPLDVVDKSLYRFPKDSKGYYVKNDGKFYIPTESQGNFIQSDARFCLFYGSRGSGKSAAGTQKALSKIEQGLDGTIINPKFEDFKTSTWEEFRRWCPPDSVVPKHRYRLQSSWEATRPFTISFMNGAKVYCKGLKDPDSARGANVNWLWYDEGGSDLTGEGWRIAIAAVRVGNNPQGWVTSTPNGVLHWMYDFFLDDRKINEIAKLPEFADRKYVEVFHGTMEDNKGNLDSAFYVSMQNAYQGWQKTQEIEGEFVSQGGTLGDPGWFNGKAMDSIPEEIVIHKRVRYWDLAASIKKVGTDPDKTVGTLFSHARFDKNWEEAYNKVATLPGHPVTDKDAFFIEDQVSGHWEWLDIKEQIWNTAVRDGHFVRVRIEQEPGSGGKNQIAELQHFFKERCSQMGIPQFDIDGHKPEGDKVVRANIWFAEASEGLIYIIKGKWVEPFFRILSGFPIIRHDDEVDSVSGARITCAPIRTWKKIDFIHI